MLKKRYGITPQQYDLLLENQRGICCICGGIETGNRYKRFEVEHDPRTGRIRGLVCHACNNAIMFYESVHEYPYFDRIEEYVRDNSKFSPAADVVADCRGNANEVARRAQPRRKLRVEDADKTVVN